MEMRAFAEKWKKMVSFGDSMRYTLPTVCVVILICRIPRNTVALSMMDNRNEQTSPSRVRVVGDNTGLSQTQLR